jgi:hypothetical protein
MLGRLVSNELEVAMAYCELLPWHLLRWTKGTTVSPSQNDRCPRRDYNPVLSEYRPEVLSL